MDTRGSPGQGRAKRLSGVASAVSHSEWAGFSDRSPAGGWGRRSAHNGDGQGDAAASQGAFMADGGKRGGRQAGTQAGKQGEQVDREKRPKGEDEQS